MLPVAQRRVVAEQVLLGIVTDLGKLRGWLGLPLPGELRRNLLADQARAEHDLADLLASWVAAGGGIELRHPGSGSEAPLITPVTVEREAQTDESRDWEVSDPGRGAADVSLAPAQGLLPVAVPEATSPKPSRPPADPLASISPPHVVQPRDDVDPTPAGLRVVAARVPTPAGTPMVLAKPSSPDQSLQRLLALCVSIFTPPTGASPVACLPARRPEAEVWFSTAQIAERTQPPTTPMEVTEAVQRIVLAGPETGGLRHPVVILLRGGIWERWLCQPNDGDDMVRWICSQGDRPDAVARVEGALTPVDGKPERCIRIVGEMAGRRHERVIFMPLRPGKPPEMIPGRWTGREIGPVSQGNGWIGVAPVSRGS